MGYMMDIKPASMLQDIQDILIYKTWICNRIYDGYQTSIDVTGYTGYTGYMIYQTWVYEYTTELFDISNWDMQQKYMVDIKPASSEKVQKSSQSRLAPAHTHTFSFTYITNTNAHLTNTNAHLTNTSANLTNTNANLTNTNAHLTNTNANLTKTNANLTNANTNYKYKCTFDKKLFSLKLPLL